MIVVGGLVVLAGVIDDLMLETNLAFIDSVGELEAVVGLRIFGRCDLLLLAALQQF